MGDPVSRINRRSHQSVFAALMKAQWRYGRKKVAIVDADGSKTTYADIMRASFGLGHAVKRRTLRGESVGVLLPTGAGAMVAFFALQAYARVPAMLNFTAGVHNIRSACTAAKVTKILTAHKFVEIAGLQDLMKELSEFAEIIYLEDVRNELTVTDKIAAVTGPFIPWFLRLNPSYKSTGVVLFTSGTEGAPKGVVLTHSNVLANVHQINEHVTLEPNDIIFNPLPTFHCYGLTAGALWPILAGKTLALHPSPLQPKIISKRIGQTNSTILLATDTFLQQYARAAGEGGLNTLRIVVCGAERVREETRSMMYKKFDCEVLEGYGVTEAAPVIAANQPGDIRDGTVGKLLPAIEMRLEPVEGLEDAGRLYVRGPNIMAGYLSADRPGEIQEPEDGWHDTGDIVSIDEEGYMSIRGRQKRFAKIGGEMVSLAVVENCASAIWPDHAHAAVTLPDSRKGEQIVLVSEATEAERPRLLSWMQSHGVPELALPKRIVHTDEIPVLGTGKTDFVGVREIAVAAMEPAKAIEAKPEEPKTEEVAVEAEVVVEAEAVEEVEAAIEKAAEVPVEIVAEEAQKEEAKPE